MSLRYKVLAVLLVLGAVFLWGRCGRPIPSGPKSPTVLPLQDKEQILVDPVKHHLTIVTPSGTQVVTLPDRQSVIDVQKNGTVKVTAPQFGLEHRFFCGLQASDAFRVAAGVDGFYWTRVDLGLGIADQVGMHTPIVFAHVSYTVYDNASIGLTYDNQQHIGALISVRI